MQIEWLTKLNYKEIKNFVDYLKKLHTDYDDLWPSQKRERDRIQNIYIPILNNEGEIPENIEFAELAKKFDCNRYTIGVELHSYYRKMTVYTHTTKHGGYIHIMNTKEASEHIGIPEHKLRRLAREGKIEAMKKGKEWRFLNRALESFLLKKDME